MKPLSPTRRTSGADAPPLGVAAPGVLPADAAHPAGAGARLCPAAEGVRRLLWAILIDAIEVYRGSRRGTLSRSAGLSLQRNREQRRERRWLESGDTTSPFSFISVCDALGLDPGYIRRLVLRPSSPALARRTQRKLHARGVGLAAARSCRPRAPSTVPASSGDGGES